MKDSLPRPKFMTLRRAAVAGTFVGAAVTGAIIAENSMWGGNFWRFGVPHSWSAGQVAMAFGINMAAFLGGMLAGTAVNVALDMRAERLSGPRFAQRQLT